MVFDAGSEQLLRAVGFSYIELNVVHFVIGEQQVILACPRYDDRISGSAREWEMITVFMQHAVHDIIAWLGEVYGGHIPIHSLRCGGAVRIYCSGGNGFDILRAVSGNGIGYTSGTVGELSPVQCQFVGQ